MKRYNYNTKKIYESTAVYKLSVEEFDAQGNSVDKNEFQDTYATLEDALEDSYELMTAAAKHDGIDEDDVDYEQGEDSVVFTAPDGRKWIFKAEVSQNEEEEVKECGDTSECEKTNEEITVPNPYSAPTTTDDVKSVESNKGVDFSDAEYIWETGTLPETIKPMGGDTASINLYFKNMMLPAIIETAPADGNHISPEGLNNIMLALVELCSEYGEINMNAFNYCVHVLCDELGVDMNDIVYKDALDIVKGANESKNESVSTRFARLRKMFESEEDDEEKSDDEKNDDEKSDDESSDDKKDDEESDDEKKDDEESNDEDEEMKAVIITVKKEDGEKCKEEMIDAGIAEDDIEILDADDEAENVEIRVDVNSVMELKDYLSKKGIDLEEEIGGEIVSDDEESGDEEDTENKDDEQGEGDDEEFDFDNLGDIFGAEDEE